MPPVQRSVHRACLRELPDSQLQVSIETWRRVLELRLSAQGLLTASLFRDGASLYFYAESLTGNSSPESLGAPGLELLLPWPEADGPRAWVTMPGVFHFNEPASVEHWRRPVPPVERQGRLLRLRPEMVASYVYYHYQLQEERAFHGEKYKWIGLHGNLLFMYNELPASVEAPPVPGRLQTQGTPKNWAEARMDLHFIPWDATTPYSRGIELVFAL